MHKKGIKGLNWFFSSCQVSSWQRFDSIRSSRLVSASKLNGLPISGFSSCFSHPPIDTRSDPWSFYNPLMCPLDEPVGCLAAFAASCQNATLADDALVVAFRILVLVDLLFAFLELDHECTEGKLVLLFLVFILNYLLVKKHSLKL